MHSNLPRYSFIASLLLLVACSDTETNSLSEQQCGINPENFAATIDGKPVRAYVLAKGDIKVAISNYGARILSICAPDKQGNLADVVLGFADIHGYQTAKEPYHGAVIGRVGNRIADGKFELAGKRYQLPINNEPNHLHGGPRGFHEQVWQVKSVNGSAIVLSYLSAHGEMGYPGNLQVEVSYSLTDQNALTLFYLASTDQTTPVNLTNHAFFNLAGEAGGTINNHQLAINADSFTPINQHLIPLGKHKAVVGTPFDFRTGKTIGQDLVAESVNQQLKNGYGYDHNFVLNKTSDELVWAATINDSVSGRSMSISTTEPGLQFYGGNFFAGADIGKTGQAHRYREAFALEPQHFPNAPNQAAFPSIMLTPDKVYQSRSVYQFAVTEHH